MILNNQQEKAVEVESPLVVVTAGPGSGKTATLVERIARDFRLRGVNPSKMGVFTFTVAAAREFEERIDKRGIPRPGYVGTLHGWCLRYGIQHGKILEAIDDTAYKKIIDLELKRLSFSDGMAAKVKSALIEGKPLSGKMSIAARAIKRGLERKAICPVSGLILVGTELLNENLSEDPGSFRPFEAIYVDEYQDTSDEDHACYGAMRAPFRFIVGDSDQSIYSFRGSNHENLEVMAREAQAWGGHVILETNYRSNPAICDHAQAIIEQVEDRVNKLTKSDLQETPEGEGVAYFKEYKTASEEITTIGDIVEDLLNDGTPAKEIAILTRYNNDAIRIADALRNGRSLPTAVRGNLGDKEKRAIEAGVALVASPTPEYLKAWEAIYGQGPGGYDPLVTAGSNLETALRISGISAVAASKIASAASQDSDQWQRGPEAVQRLRDAAIEYLADNVDDDKIPVLTMHASKGREWDFVLIAHADSRALPPTDEARRLAFVASTRARRFLSVSCASSKPDFTGRVESGLTRSGTFV